MIFSTGATVSMRKLARTVLLRSLELEVQQIRDLGYRLYVIETRCRYAFPLRYAERARVTAWVKDVDNRITIAYEVFNLTAGRRSARGQTVLASTDADGTLLLETPDALRRRLRP